jgi:hypothetical protein
MDHEPGNLFLTGINRSTTPAFVHLLGVSAWTCLLRNRQPGASYQCSRPPFLLVLLPLFVLLQATHMPNLLSRGDRPWQVPRTKFQRITMSSEPNKAHNAWALSLTKTNFLFHRVKDIPVTPGRRQHSGIYQTWMKCLALSLLISLLRTLTYSIPHLFSYTRFIHTFTARWYINLPQPLTFFRNTLFSRQ